MITKTWQFSIFLFSLILFFPPLLTAQKSTTGNSKIINLSDASTSIKATEKNILSYLKLDNAFDLKLKSENKRSNTKRYQLQHKGIEVKHMHLISHNKSDQLSRLIVNKRLEDIRISEHTLVLSPNEAVEKFATSIADKNPFLKQGASGPKIKQIYYPAIKNSKDYVLCYEVLLMVEEDPFQFVGYVDVTTGRIIAVSEAAMSCSTPGTAATLFSGTQNFTTNEVSPTDFTLFDCTRGDGILTQNVLNGYNTNAPLEFHDDDNNWDANSSLDPLHQSALDAHWGTQLCYDYFDNNYNVDVTHGEELNSLLSTGGLLWNNAVYVGDRNEIYYGSVFNGNAHMTTPDVVGHEVMHGVTFHSADLIYADESGSINESYSDIFGAIIQGEAGQFNWLMNEQLFTVRSLSDPNAFNHPDTYGGLHYYTGADQGILVHTNSGILNHWFYLLVDGGQGINDLGNGYSVTGIPLNDAAEIAMTTLLNYLQPSSNFQDFRIAAINATIDLFGNCSPELEAVINALYAVGIGPEYNVPEEIQNPINGPITNCSAKVLWDDNGSPLYDVYYKESTATNWDLIAAIPVNEVVISNLTSNTMYDWYVVNPCNSNPNFQIISFTTGSTCAVATNFVQSNISVCSIDISWDDLGAESYTVFYREDLTSPYASITTTTNSVLLTGLINGGTYEYYIVTNCSSQCTSENSSIDKFVLNNCQVNTSVFVQNVGGCYTNIAWVPIAGQSYSVQWRYNTANTPGMWNTGIPNPGDNHLTVNSGSPQIVSIDIILTTICEGDQCSIILDSPIHHEFYAVPLPGAVCTPPSAVQITINTDGLVPFWTATWIGGAGSDFYDVRWRFDADVNWETRGFNDDLFHTEVIEQSFTCIEVQVQSLCCIQGTVAGAWISQTLCLPCDPPTDLVIDDICPNQANLYYSSIPSMNTIMIDYRPIGTTTWFHSISSLNPAPLLLLVPDTDYEVEVYSRCGEPNNYVFSPIQDLTFSTPAICVPPTGLMGTALSSSVADLEWTPIPDNWYYILEYRQASSTVWTEAVVFPNSAQLSNVDLVDGIFYRVRAICNPCDQSGWSAEIFVQFDAGDCIPGLYMGPDPNETGCDPCVKDCYVCLFDENDVKLMENGNWYEIIWTSFPPGYQHPLDAMYNGQCLSMGPQHVGQEFTATINWKSIIDDANPVSQIICSQEFTYVHACPVTDDGGKGRGEIVNTSTPKFYPNPTSDNIILENPGDDLLEVTLLDINGRILINENLMKRSKKEMGLSGLSGAVYYLKFRNVRSEEIIIEKIILMN